MFTWECELIAIPTHLWHWTDLQGVCEGSAPCRRMKFKVVYSVGFYINLGKLADSGFFRAAIVLPYLQFTGDDITAQCIQPGQRLGVEKCHISYNLIIALLSHKKKKHRTIHIHTIYPCQEWSKSTPMPGHAPIVRCRPTCAGYARDLNKRKAPHRQDLCTPSTSSQTTQHPLWEYCFRSHRNRRKTKQTKRKKAD
jgi:hypothetical protein